MRRVTLPVLVAFLAGVGSLAAGDVSRTVNLSWEAQGWIVLQVHDDLFLGVATRDYFDPATQTFRPLESVGNPILVASNYPGGVLLTLQAVGWQVPAEFPGSVPEDLLADLEWRLSGGIYQPVGTGETVVWSAEGPAAVELLVDYRYRLDVDDVPGRYSVTLLYTASAP